MTTLRKILEDNSEIWLSDGAENWQALNLLESCELTEDSELDKEAVFDGGTIRFLGADGYIQNGEAPYIVVDPIEESFLRYDFDAIISDAEENLSDGSTEAEVYLIRKGNEFFNKEDLAQAMIDELSKYNDKFVWSKSKVYSGIAIFAEKK